MSSVALDQELFFRRLNRFYASWNENKDNDYWKGVDAFCVVAGKANSDDSSYRHSAVMQVRWV